MERRNPLISRALYGLCAALAAGTVVAACGSQDGTAAPVQQNGVVQQLSGADVYQMSCARCHGADRQGKTDAPKLDTVRMASIGDEPMRMVIKYGKGRMPGFGGLTDDKVDRLIEWLRA